MVRTPCSQGQGPDSIPSRGTKVPQFIWHGQKNTVKKKKRRSGPKLNRVRILATFTRQGSQASARCRIIPLSSSMD